MRCCRNGIGLLIAAGSAFPMAAMSSDMEIEVYPKRSIKLVVGYPPGDAPDVVARHLAQEMSEDLGQKVVVANRPDAAGYIGAASVARGEPDGYTVVMAARPVVLHKVMYEQVNSTNTPQALDTFMVEDTETWTEVLEQARIRGLQ